MSVWDQDTPSRAMIAFERSLLMEQFAQRLITTPPPLHTQNQTQWQIFDFHNIGTIADQARQILPDLPLNDKVFIFNPRHPDIRIIATRISSGESSLDVQVDHVNSMMTYSLNWRFSVDAYPGGDGQYLSVLMGLAGQIWCENHRIDSEIRRNLVATIGSSEVCSAVTMRLSMDIRDALQRGYDELTDWLREEGSLTGWEEHVQEVIQQSRLLEQERERESEMESEQEEREGGGVRRPNGTHNAMATIPEDE